MAPPWNPFLHANRIVYPYWDRLPRDAALSESSWSFKSLAWKSVEKVGTFTFMIEDWKVLRNLREILCQNLAFFFSKIQRHCRINLLCLLEQSVLGISYDVTWPISRHHGVGGTHTQITRSRGRFDANTGSQLADVCIAFVRTRSASWRSSRARKVLLLSIGSLQERGSSASHAWSSAKNSPIQPELLFCRCNWSWLLPPRFDKRS